MDATTKDALAISIAVPSLFTVLLFAAYGTGIGSAICAVLAFCFAPLGVFGAVMLTRRDASRWVNLPVHEDCEHIDDVAHMFGASVIIGTAVISVAVSLMIQGRSPHRRPPHRCLHRHNHPSHVLYLKDSFEALGHPILLVAPVQDLHRLAIGSPRSRTHRGL